jgi:hypothetical protein
MKFSLEKMLGSCQICVHRQTYDLHTWEGQKPEHQWGLSLQLAFMSTKPQILHHSQMQSIQMTQGHVNVVILQAEEWCFEHAISQLNTQLCNLCVLKNRNHDEEDLASRV